MEREKEFLFEDESESTPQQDIIDRLYKVEAKIHQRQEFIPRNG